MKKPSGELTIELALAPVSQQSRSSSKAEFQSRVREITSKYEFLLGGDVSVSVEWHVSEQVRYETDRAPDVDNILKPLLDSLVGLDGLLIDDNQIQHVSCHWLDSYTSEEKLLIKISHSPDEWLKKECLFFVRLDSGLCIPLSRNMPRKFQNLVINNYKKALSFRDKLMVDGVSYYDAKGIMPIQRVFHRSRLGAFEIIDANEFDGASDLLPPNPLPS